STTAIVTGAEVAFNPVLSVAMATKVYEPSAATDQFNTNGAFVATPTGFPLAKNSTREITPSLSDGLATSVIVAGARNKAPLVGLVSDTVGGGGGRVAIHSRSELMSA